MMTKRNSYLDVAKFLFSIIIILYHFDVFFLGGYIVVEAFFMISGFFLMSSVKKSDDTLPLGEQTAKFVAHKYKSIAFFLIPSAIIGCIAYIWIIPRPTESVLMQASLMIFEMLPTQVAGFNGFYATGVSWYLSALFIGCMIVFPLAKRFKTGFTLWIAPLAAILCYGYLTCNFSYIGVPNLWINQLFNSGLLRAIAGLCAGCFLHECSVRLGDKRPSLTGKILMTLLEVVGWGYCVYVMHNYPESMYDASVVFIMFGLLLIGINRYSYLTDLIQFRWTKHLATVSTVVYLNHYYWGRLILKVLPDLSRGKQIALYLALIAVSSTFVYFVGRLLMTLWDKRKKRALQN